MAPTEFERIVSKIKKCLALSESDNENEAALAAARAHELMTKYRIEMAQLREETGEEISVREHELFQGRALWHTQLALHIAAANNCGVFKRRKTLIIVGTPENIQIVEYFYSYLCRMLRHLMRVYCREFYGSTKVETRIKLAFCEGATETVGRRMRERNQEMRDEAEASKEASTCTALVRIDREHEAVSQYMEDLGLRKGRRRRAHNDPQARSHGRQAGEMVQIRDAIKQPVTRKQLS